MQQKQNDIHKTCPLCSSDDKTERTVLTLIYKALEMFLDEVKELNKRVSRLEHG